MTNCRRSFAFKLQFVGWEERERGGDRNYGTTLRRILCPLAVPYSVWLEYHSLSQKNVSLYFTACIRQLQESGFWQSNNLFNVKSPKCAIQFNTLRPAEIAERQTQRAVYYKGSDVCAPVYCMAIPVSKAKWPGRGAKSVGHS